MSPRDFAGTQLYVYQSCKSDFTDHVTRFRAPPALGERALCAQMEAQTCNWLAETWRSCSSVRVRISVSSRLHAYLQHIHKCILFGGWCVLTHPNESNATDTCYETIPGSLLQRQCSCNLKFLKYPVQTINPVPVARAKGQVQRFDAADNAEGGLTSVERVPGARTRGPPAAVEEVTVESELDRVTELGVGAAEPAIDRRLVETDGVI